MSKQKTYKIKHRGLPSLYVVVDAEVKNGTIIDPTTGEGFDQPTQGELIACDMMSSPTTYISEKPPRAFDQAVNETVYRLIYRELDENYQKKRIDYLHWSQIVKTAEAIPHHAYTGTRLRLPNGNFVNMHYQASVPYTVAPKRLEAFLYLGGIWGEESYEIIKRDVIPGRLQRMGLETDQFPSLKAAKRWAGNFNLAMNDTEKDKSDIKEAIEKIEKILLSYRGENTRFFHNVLSALKIEGKRATSNLESTQTGILMSIEHLVKPIYFQEGESWVETVKNKIKNVMGRQKAVLLDASPIICRECGDRITTETETADPTLCVHCEEKGK